MSHQLIGICFAECLTNKDARAVYDIAKGMGIKAIPHVNDTDTCIMYGDDEEILVCGIDFPREAMPTNEISRSEFINRLLNNHK